MDEALFLNVPTDIAVIQISQKASEVDFMKEVMPELQLETPSTREFTA